MPKQASKIDICDVDEPDDTATVMLQTIKLSKNLKILSSRLPKSNYGERYRHKSVLVSGTSGVQPTTTLELARRPTLLGVNIDTNESVSTNSQSTAEEKKLDRCQSQDKSKMNLKLRLQGIVNKLNNVSIQ